MLRKKKQRKWGTRDKRSTLSTYGTSRNKGIGSTSTSTNTSTSTSTLPSFLR